MLDDRQQLRGACRLSGEVDIATARAAGIELLAAAIATPGASVEIDCARLTFIDASGVTMLLRVAMESGKAVRLVNLVRCCGRVFEILDLCEQFGIPVAQRLEDSERRAIPA